MMLDYDTSTLSFEEVPCVFVGSIGETTAADRIGQNIDHLSTQGTQTSREGWCEDKCRAFVVKYCQFIPRNYDYADGLRLLYPLLQYAFGDEHLDLVTGVVWEFIEVEEPPPYPESLFQRWKFKHSHRFEDLCLPHVPHANTIARPAIPTERLRKWRQSQKERYSEDLSHENLSLPKYSVLQESPIPLRNYILATSNHKPSANRREDAIYVSTGGSAPARYVLKQEAKYDLTRNPSYGRGGKLHSVKKLNTEYHEHKEENMPSSSVHVDLTVKSLKRRISQRATTLWKKAESRLEARNHKIVDKDLTAEPVVEVLPPRIPNGNFARKFALVSQDLPLRREEIFEQRTACQKLSETDQFLWIEAVRAAMALRAETEPDLSEVCRIFRRVTSDHDRQPLTPDLFFDHYNEFEFESSEPCHLTSSITDEDWKDNNRRSLKVGVKTAVEIPSAKTASKSSLIRASDLDGNGGDSETSVISDLVFRDRSWLSDKSFPEIDTLQNDIVPPDFLQPKVYNPEDSYYNSSPQVFCVFETLLTGPGLQLSDILLLADARPEKLSHKCKHSEVNNTHHQMHHSNDISTHVTGCKDLVNWVSSLSSLACYRTTSRQQNNFLSPKQAHLQKILLSVSSQRSLRFDLTMETTANRRTPQAITIPQPLRVHKQTSPTTSLNAHAQPMSYLPSGLPDDHPLRKLSVDLADNTDRHQVRYQESHPRVQSHVASVDYSPDTSVYSTETPYVRHLAMTRNNPTGDTAVSINNEKQIVESSSDILGNFVIIASSDSTESSVPTQYSSSHNNQNLGRNKYEFETSPLFDNLHRQTTLSEFVAHSQDDHVESRRYTDRNSYLNEDKAKSPRPTSLHIPLQTPRGRNLQRSESSPNVTPSRFRANPHRSPSPDIPRYYYGEYDTPIHHRNHAMKPSTTSQRGRKQHAESMSGSTTFGRPPNDKSSSAAESAHRLVREHELRGRQNFSVSSKSSRYDLSSATNPSLNTSYDDESATKILNHSRSLHEHLATSVDPFVADLRDSSTQDSLSACGAEQDAHATGIARREKNVKKRSRSPMKKMFGDKGWLGRSPSELNSIQSLSNMEVPDKKKQTQTSKPGIMSKLRHKLDKVAERADLNSTKNFSDSNKLPKTSVLVVSLGPPEQARIYMELELMLVHTANSFLMSQFSQGRIAIDSIKKTFDMWKSKGRPSVLEFMYDQLTQRDLIAANQHTFSFHGNRAGDGIRINSVLYNWKQVASHMSIRTFCNVDSVILKLIFDIGQVLDLLGAADGILSRYQSIRISVNEKVRIAREKQKPNSEKFEHGRQLSWDTRHPSEAFSLKHGSIDTYGGMKLVPDSYIDLEA